MSQYGLPFDYDEPWLSGALDLCIETLTGTAFEIRVAPTDTIMSIKTKIQRVEGIPVSQQHLLYNLVELDNSASVQDYSIQNGATLKLILSMRGGPISTRRLPPADEALLREVQEWMADGCREERADSLSSSSKTSILVFRDGDSVNWFRVVENDDGTYSPLAQSWSASSMKGMLAKEESVDTDKRLMENWVTMGKMQELKGKLEKLSVTKKDRKPDDDNDKFEDWWSEPVEKEPIGSEASSGEVSPSYYLRARGSFSEPDVFPVPRTAPGKSGSISELSPLLPLKRSTGLAEATTSSGVRVPPNNTRPLRVDPENSQTQSPLSRPLNQTFINSMRKARKEAENIIRLQSKSLSVVVDSHSCGNLKRTPLPEIRRSPRSDRGAENLAAEEKKDLRVKTEGRMSTPSFAIVNEERDLAGAAGICSSESSMMAMPTNDDMVVAFSPISRDHGSASMGCSRIRVSRFYMEKDERPKTMPTKLEKCEKEAAKTASLVADPDEQNRKHVMCSTVDLAPSWYKNSRGLSFSGNMRRLRATLHNDLNTKMEPESTVGAAGLRPQESPEQPDLQVAALSRPSSPVLPLPLPLPPPPATKKRSRCLVCNKRLNITNTHTCRCSGIFCAIHRYSETHDCHFDYKEEGKHLLRLANPLVTAAKLPKI